MKRILCLLLLLPAAAFGAKVPVSLVTPSSNTDGSTLTDLAQIVVEWGTCVGSEFGVRQSAVAVQTTATGVALRTFIYPSGLSKVCARAFAINSKGAMSAPSNPASKNLIPTLGKPVILGQAIELLFNSQETNDGKTSDSEESRRPDSGNNAG